MHSILFKYISEKTGMTLQEFEDEIQPFFIPRKLQKKDFLLKQGEVCDTITFICKGLTRTYTIDCDDSKHILAFGFENYWITDREGFNMKTPSQKYIQALEESDVLDLKKKDYDQLLESNKLFRSMTNALKERNAIVTFHKVASMKDDSAEEKYRKFLEKFSEITQRIPQHMIASYLGIKPETLSRLRKRPNKK